FIQKFIFLQSYRQFQGFEGWLLCWCPDDHQPLSLTEQEQGKDKSLEGRFSPPPGTRFRVRVGFDDVSVTEDFIA
ncbi:MAG: hypothetical protein F6J86_43585, partial [Symploca sp. SIO1B1]|nr:hypothetical protein [Symploca sp. SIO1B1]